MPKNGLPSFYEYLKEHGKTTGLFAFDYDRDQQKFFIGGETTDLADFDPYSYSPDLEAENEEVSFDEMRDLPLMIPILSGVIGGPRLHQWAKENPDTLRETAVEIMHNAFTSLADEEFARDIKNEPAGFMGFDSGVRQHGGIHLQVFGSCACMGVSQDGMFINEGVEKGFGQYELHNADSQAQRTSLYAGLGHIARLVSES